MNFILKFFSRYWIILYIFSLSLIPVFWIPQGYVLAGGDDVPFLNPASLVDTSTWDNSGFANTFNRNYSWIFPWGMQWIVFQNLGFSNTFAEQFWLFSMWAIAGFSLFLLLKICFPEKYKFISFFAIPLYLLAPFNTFIPITLALSYTHSFLPLMLAIIIKGLKQKTIKLRFIYAIFFALASLFTVPAFSNPAFGIILIFVPLIYVIFYILFEREEKRIIQPIIYFIFSVVLFFLFNLFWIWTLFSVSSVVGFMSTYNWGYFGTSSIFDVFRTLGGWAMGKDPMKVFEHSYYESFGIVFVTYLVVFISFISIFYIRKSKKLLFFLILTVISIFLIKGTLDPWGDIYKFLFEKFSFVKPFREPWTKFTPMYVLCLSVLYGYSSVEIVSFLKNIKNKLFIAPAIFLLLLFVFISGFPAIFGFNLWRYNLSGQKSVLVKIPSYWYDMVHFFNTEDKDGVVYITPRNLAARDYNWESGVSGMMPNEYLFIKNPIRYSDFLVSTVDKDYINFLLLCGNYASLESDTFINFLSMLSVKYIIQENDILWGPGAQGNYPPKLMSYVLAKSPYLEKIKQFGKIDIYRVKSNYYKDIIYPSKKVIALDGPAFTISSWHKPELDNFSVIRVANPNVQFQNSGLDIAFQKSIGVSTDVSEQKTLDFELPVGGTYEVYMNMRIFKQAQVLNISYSIDSTSPKSLGIKVLEPPEIGKYMGMLSLGDMNKSIYLDSLNLEAGKHTLILKSSDFIKKDFGGINFVVLNKDFSSKEEKVNLPSIKINKIDDTKYFLNVKNAAAPYILNFSQDFDPGWELSLVSDNDTKVLSIPHFLNNGINNGWYINMDSTGNKKDYTLKLEFIIQRKFVKYLYISIISIIAGLLVLIYLYNKSEKSKKNDK